MDSPINLKKSLRDRMDKAGVGGDTPSTPDSAASAPTGYSKAMRPFTPAEKKAQAEKLADILRKRGQ